MAVLEPMPGHVTSEIRDRLMDGSTGNSVVFTCGERLSVFSGTYDLFVVVGGKAEESAPALHTKILLVPDKVSPETVAEISSGWVVSYGLSGKASITLSSLESSFAVLALQRELVTLADTVVEQQEIPLRFSQGLGAQALMAVYGSLLMLGIQPEALRETAS